MKNSQICFSGGKRYFNKYFPGANAPWMEISREAVGTIPFSHHAVHPWHGDHQSKVLFLRAGLQTMAVSNEILGVQEQHIECTSVQFYLSVHFQVCT